MTGADSGESFVLVRVLSQEDRAGMMVVDLRTEVGSLGE